MDLHGNPRESKSSSLSHSTSSLDKDDEDSAMTEPSVELVNWEDDDKQLNHIDENFAISVEKSTPEKVSLSL